MNGKNIIIALIALAVLGVAYMQFSADAPESKTQDATTMEKKEKNNADIIVEELQNGTYEATGEYISPAGPESIDVTLTLQDGVVTDADVVSKAVNQKSIAMQELFIGAYESEVVGKNISDISLDVVGGSSLTPEGFQDALDKIIQQAQS